MSFPRFALFWCICVSAVSSSALDREAFTFTHYLLDVRVEPEQQRLAVRGTITLRNDSAAPQKNAVLQISSSLDWRSIRVEGSPVQFVSQVYTSDIDHTGALSEAIVTLPRVVQPHAMIDLQIGYEGVVAQNATRLTRVEIPEEKARHSDWDQISREFTAVRGIGYVTWYPVATEAANLSQGNSVFEAVGRWKAKEVGSEMSLSFSTTAKQPVLASGTRTNFTVLNLDSKDSNKYSSYTIVNFGVTVPSFVLADYDVSEKPAFSKVYYLPGHENAARLYSEESAKLQDFISFLGRGHGSVTVAELADSEAAPFESDEMLLTPLSRDAQFVDITLVHALAHTHFRSARPWIDEGLAHFAQALWREQQAGRQAALDYMGPHRTALEATEKAAAEQKDSAAAQSLISTSEEEYYRSKAMFVWWMLRDMVGDVALKRAIAGYESQRDTQPSYVQKLIEKQSHRDLEWFFDDWVYRDRGLPDFRVASAYTRQMLNGTYLLTVSVENRGGAGAEVPLRVRLEGGDVTSRVEVRSNATGVVRIEVPSPPREIVVNDGSVPEADTGNNTFEIQKSKN
ncbi:MAG TPA: hypothetical protein VF011_10580 [Terriglobales bacterium]